MEKRSPWIFIPTLYFAQGLPYTIVMMMSAVYFKDLGADNVLIGLSSSLQLPWIFKFAWAPLIDFFSFKKKWIVVAQAVLAVLFTGLAFTAVGPDPVHAAFPVLALMALASATHDASIDGYYLEALERSEQALFVGVRNTAFRLSMLFGNGAMVFLAGSMAATMGKQGGWSLAFFILAAVMGIEFLFHSWYLPSRQRVVASGPSTENIAAPQQNAATTQSNSVVQPNLDAQPIADHPPRDYFRAILTYFDQPRAAAIVLYILTFRLGDALVMKMIPAFLKDPAERGGLDLSVQEIGIVFGTVGVCFLLLGGIVGGYVVSKGGLKKWLWPATLIMNGTILLYWLLALYRPPIVWVYVVNSLEQFGYGLGMAAYTVFLLSTVKQEYKAAHYAVATAMMALGLMIPGMASGYMLDGMSYSDINLFGLQHLIAQMGGSGFHLAGLGYANFFLVSFLLSIPGIISIFLLPIWMQNSDKESSTR